MSTADKRCFVPDGRTHQLSVNAASRFQCFAHLDDKCCCALYPPRQTQPGQICGLLGEHYEPDLFTSSLTQ